jgi:predicted membrane protein
MTGANAFRITPRLIVGLGILTLGTLWTLDNLNILESEEITAWWPLILITIGIVQLVNRHANRVGPALLIFVGAMLLASSLGYIDFDLGDLIPFGIALFGGKLVWDALARRSARPALAHDASTVHAFAVMAGVKRHLSRRDFRGGDLSAIMGGVELDLRNAQILPGEEVVIDTLAIMGGIEIFVPREWRIASDVLPLMGGFEDNTSPTSETGATLTIRGTVIMGAIEIKN